MKNRTFIELYKFIKYHMLHILYYIITKILFMFYINRKSKKSKKAILSNKKSSTIKSMANLILGSYTLSITMIFFLYCIQFSD